MARNEEKKQSMLNRFLQAKVDEERGPRAKRPYLATECMDLNECDKWRRQILTEIGKKVGEIQNAGLGEHRIRDLNDEINKLIREKGHWERHIVELGGPDYSKISAAVAAEGNDMASATGRSGGYKYFGAAKLLPGVKELFEKEAPKIVRRSRHQMHKSIDPDYYGFRDEDDGVLEKVEMPAEQLLRAQLILEWEEKEQERRSAIAGGDALGDAAAAGLEGAEADGAERFVAYVPLPDQRAIEARVLEKKKADLLAKYTSEALQQGQEEAKALLNKH